MKERKLNLPKIRLKKQDRDVDPVKRTGIYWYIFLLSNHFFRMLGLNLLTVACCATVVLAPAAVSAACKAVLMMVKGEGGLFWEDYRQEFREKLPQKLGYWVMMMLVPLSVALWCRMFGMPAEVAEWILYFGLLLSAVVQAYFFTMAAAVELPLATCMKNALLLTVLELPSTLLMLAVFAAVLVGMYLLYPYSIPLLFIVFSGTILFICQTCRAVFLKRELMLPRTGGRDVKL